MEMKLRKPEKYNRYKEFMKTVLDKIPEKVHPEYKFDSKRKFRFDYAIPDLKIAIEYEGIMGSARLHRHTTKTGYTKDTEKYNLAAINGWRVLRYTAMNVCDLAQDIEKILGRV